MAWVDVTSEDISNRWRPLTPGEAAIIDTLIADAQDILEETLEARGLTGIPSAPTDAERWQRAYIRVVATMVKRVLQNPEGFLSTAFTIDDYRQEYRRDSAVSAGVLYVSDLELNGLIPGARRRRGAFSIVLGNS
jgi:hypothetical protein